MSETYKEKPLKISCHCNVILTTASYYPFFTRLDQNSGALRSLDAGQKKKPKETFARQEAATDATPLLSNYPHLGPDTHWERIFRKRQISPRSHFMPTRALLAGISNLQLALDYPQLSPAGLGPERLPSPPCPLLILVGPRASSRKKRGSSGFLQAPSLVLSSQTTSRLARPASPGAALGNRAAGLPPTEADKKREGKREDGACLRLKYLVECTIRAPHFHHQLLHLLDSPAGARSPPRRGGLRELKAQPPPPPPPPPPPALNVGSPPALGLPFTGSETETEQNA